MLLFSLFPPAWLVGTAGLSVAKILENMEIGHNVMHGQWDWMRDPEIHSTTWEWDNATPSEQWKHSHNYLHHTYTNIIGQGQRPRLRHHAGRRGPALAPAVPGPAAVELRQRVHLPVRHRRLRPRARQEPVDQAAPAGPRVPGPGAGRSAEEDPPAGHQGLRAAPAAVRPVVPAHHGRQRDGQPGPQHLDPLGHHVRPLPRRASRPSPAARSRARPAASGTCVRCSARPTSVAAGPCTS